MDDLDAPGVASLYAASPPADARRLAGQLDDVATPARHAAAVEADRNEAGNGCHRRFSTADARIKLASRYPSIGER